LLRRFCSVSNHELLKQGFLGTAAPLYADLVLLFEIGVALVLLLGAFLARIGKYRWHALCQSTVVLLNLIIILTVMVPAFHPGDLSKLRRKPITSYSFVSSAHAVLGFSAETLGLYILLAAGTRILPERLRFRNYKLWMRSALLLWWSAVLLGIATYMRLYVF
jgi:uncharacterized membrane protein YozB (DUF420 family)